MGLSKDNVEGYREGSPLDPHAKNLQGKLLIMHGKYDDNVMIVILKWVNELIKNNKLFRHDVLSYEGSQHQSTGNTTLLFMKDYGKILEG